MTWKLILPVFLVVAVPTQAQELPSNTPTDARCFYASISFSPGAEVSFGALEYRCVVTDGYGKWENASSHAAKSCIFESKLYAAGARVGTADDKVQCQPDGTWARQKIGRSEEAVSPRAD